MFSSLRQQQIRRELLAMAEADPTITGAAITGSHARGVADRWSDVDLFFGCAPGSTPAEVADTWMRRLDERFGVAHYFDLHGDGALYRAFLLMDAVEVDLGFADEMHFHSIRGEAFDVVLGRLAMVEDSGAADSVDERTPIGCGWHHLIHARVCLERNQLWQGLYWTNALRDVLTTAMCRRLDLPTSYSKGVDLLPSRVRASLLETVPAALSQDAVDSCLERLTDLFLVEIGRGPGGSGDPLALVVEKLRDFAWSSAPAT